MSALTPEAARAAAEWLDTLDPCGYPSAAYVMRREADRLEAAARTAGQVLAEVQGECWEDLNENTMDLYEDFAAAVIAHHVGPDRVVVDRYAVLNAVEVLHPRKYAATLAAFREALS